MKIMDGQRVEYESDEEFYSWQAQGAHPHDKDKIVQARLRKALRFLMFGDIPNNVDQHVKRKKPNYAEDVAFLDAGCRDGWSLDYLAKGCPASFLKSVFRDNSFINTAGIELCRQTVNYAQKKGRNVVQGDIRETCLGENEFDLIFSSHCLEHLDKPLDALQNLQRMLKPGGTILALVPLETEPITEGGSSLHSWQFRQEEDLKNLMEKAGFEVIEYFTLQAHKVRRRRHWYRLKAKTRIVGPELWAVATKNK